MRPDCPPPRPAGFWERLDSGNPHARDITATDALARPYRRAAFFLRAKRVRSGYDTDVIWFRLL